MITVQKISKKSGNFPLFIFYMSYFAASLAGGFERSFISGRMATRSLIAEIKTSVNIAAQNGNVNETVIGNFALSSSL